MGEASLRGYATDSLSEANVRASANRVALWARGRHVRLRKRRDRRHTRPGPGRREIPEEPERGSEVPHSHNRGVPEPEVARAWMDLVLKRRGSACWRVYNFEPVGQS